MGAVGEETRRRLVVVATEEFAHHGIHTASLLEIARRAGQRNRGAVHYHFGSRDGMLAAVVDQHVPVLSRREHQLMEAARARPDDDLVSVVHAMVQPSVELLELGDQGRCFLMILSQVVDEEEDALGKEAVAALRRTGGLDTWVLLEERMPAMPAAVCSERVALTTHFILRSVADYGRGADVRLPPAGFARNLTAMAVAMLTAPLPERSARP